MLEKKRIRIIQIICLGTLTACQISPIPSEKSIDPLPQTSDLSSPAQVDSPLTDSATQKSTAASASAPDTSTAYQDAINLASSAFTLGQQATSPDDWDLIVGRWEQAIQKLNEVSPDHQNYAAAQIKLKEYERNLAQANQHLAKLLQPPAEIVLDSPADRPIPIANGSTAAVATTPVELARIPIIERRGGTPVIEVTFNGRRYPMILDTGASHTHITRAMANDLDIDIVGQASVATASNSQVAVDVGYVESVRVANITRSNLPVSIGDAVPIGLLGNDVYKNFDVILQADAVEFRPR